MSKFAPEIVHGDWHTVELALRKIMQKIGPLSEPTFGGLTIDGSTISAAVVGNWNTAYGWGNHADAGYITSISGGDHSDLDNLDFASSGHSGFQAEATNLTSLAGLTFASTSFVKMTATGTFALDTSTYLTTESDPVAMGYIDQAVKVASTPTFASLSVTDLTSGGIPYAYTGGLLKYSANLTFDGTVLGSTAFKIKNSSADWLLSFDAQNIPYLQRQAASNSNFRIYKYEKSNGNANMLQIMGLGDPTSNTNVEQLAIGWPGSSIGYNVIASHSTGSGTVRPLRLYTGTNTTQLVLNVDGSVSVGGDLSATSFTGTVYGVDVYGTIWADGAVDDGTYTVGNRITPVTGDLGTITVQGGIITGIQQAT